MGEAFVYLHKMPGPHNADVRGNSAAHSRVARGRGRYWVLCALHHHQRHLPVVRAPGRAARLGLLLLSWPAQARSGGWCMPSQLDDGISPERRERSAAGTVSRVEPPDSLLPWFVSSVLHVALRHYRVVAESSAMAVCPVLAESRADHGGAPLQLDRRWIRCRTGARSDAAARNRRGDPMAGETVWRPFAFQVSRPGLVLDVKADLERVAPQCSALS